MFSIIQKNTWSTLIEQDWFYVIWNWMKVDYIPRNTPRRFIFNWKSTVWLLATTTKIMLSRGGTRIRKNDNVMNESMLPCKSANYHCRRFDKEIRGVLFCRRAVCWKRINWWSSALSAWSKLTSLLCSSKRTTKLGVQNELPDINFALYAPVACGNKKGKKY